MSVEQDRLIAALEEAELHLVGLARALGSVSTALHTVSRQAYDEGGSFRQFDVTQELSMERVHRTIVRRLRGLGLDGLLGHARTAGRGDETWVAGFSDHIRRLVP